MTKKPNLDQAYKSLLEQNQNEGTNQQNSGQQPSKPQPATQLDIQNLANDLIQAIQNRNQKLGQSFDEIAQQAIKQAYEAGRKKSFGDVTQRLDGQQSRLDAINVNQNQSFTMATADHSKLSQLSKYVTTVVNAVNHNADLQAQLIRVLQQPIQINVQELLKAIEAEQGQAMSQLISRNTAKFILDAQSVVRNDVEKNEQIKAEINRQTQTTNQRIHKLEARGTGMLIGLIGAAIVPFWWLKLLVAGAGIVGGYLYGEIK